MIYEHFCMRLHEDLPRRFTTTNVPAQKPWTLRVGDGVLKSFVVGSVSNPTPAIKENKIDVSGISGELDIYGSNNPADFQNKTVTIVLSGEASFAGMKEIEDLFSEYQGRVIDFTFDYFLQVEKYQVGRMTAAFDRKRNRVTLTIDAEPFRYSTEIVQDYVMWRDNWERDKNTSSWVVPEYTDFYYQYDTRGKFAYSVKNPTTIEYDRYKPTGASAGSKLLLGVLSLVGGTVCFVDNDGNESSVYATACDPVHVSDTGELRMKFTVDGSYYEWVTTKNGTREYLPTIRCEYILSDYVPIDSDGNIVNVSGGGIMVIDDLPSNIAIYPDFFSIDEWWIIADGVASSIFDGTIYNRNSEKAPKIKIPNQNAERHGTKSKSIICAVMKKDAEIAVVPIMRYVPIEVY